MKMNSSTDNDRTESRIEFANTLRGLACLCVVVAHYMGVFWIAPNVTPIFTGIPPSPNHHIPPYILAVNSIPNFNWGAFGVGVFYLISGFVVPFSFLRQNRRQFAINRIFRIWPTYLAGFACTVGAVMLGCHYFGTNVPFTSEQVLIHTIPGLRDLAQSRDIDGIIWTLEVEVKFYFLCLLIAPLLRKRSGFVFAVPVCLSTVALVACLYLDKLCASFPAFVPYMFLAINATQYLSFMFIGVVFHFLHLKSIEPIKAVLTICGLFVMTCLVWSYSPYKASFPVAWNYGFAVVAFAFAAAYPRLLKSNPVFDFLAKISYPMYVCHGIGGYVLMRVLQNLDFHPISIIVTVTTTAFVVSWLLHLLIEKPSMQLGKWLSKRCSSVADSVAKQSILEFSQSKEHDEMPIRKSA